jgi:hypothetical protein
VIRTRSIDHTVLFLQSTHRQVARRFLAHGSSFEYADFEEYQRFDSLLTSMSYLCGVDLVILTVLLSNDPHVSLWGKKTVSTVGELFGHMLRQVSGCGTPSVLPIVDKFKTLPTFMKWIRQVGEVQATVSSAPVCAA